MGGSIPDNYSRCARSGTIAVMRGLTILGLLATVGCDKQPPVPPGQDPIDVAVLVATYAENSDAPSDVKKKCKFHERVSKAIVYNAPGSKLSTHESDKVLALEIVTMHGVDPTSAGDRTVIVTGDLKEGSASIGTFHIRREAPAGVMGGMSGVCSSLKEIADIMGEDVGAWLADPGSSSEL